MKRQTLRLVCTAIAMLALAACQIQLQPPVPSPTVPVSTATPTPASVRTSFIAVVPEQASKGDQVTIVGTDWPAGYNIALELRPAESTAGAPIGLGTVTVDSQGHFRFVSIVPQAAATGLWT